VPGLVVDGVAAWWFTSMRGLRAVAQGVSVPGFPSTFQLLVCDLCGFLLAVKSLSLSDFQKARAFLCHRGIIFGTCSEDLLPCFLSIQGPPRMHCVCALVQVAGAGCSAVLGSVSLPLCLFFSCRELGKGHSGHAWLGILSYPFHQALGSRWCSCSLAVVLCLLVSLLGLFEFVVFSKIYVIMGGDSHCPTHAATFSLPCGFIFCSSLRMLLMFILRSLTSGRLI